VVAGLRARFPRLCGAPGRAPADHRRRLIEFRQILRFVPDCAVLFKRLLGDKRVSRPRKLVLAGMLGYLAMPFDLIPDFIPFLGQLDDAVVVAVGLRVVLRGAGPQLVRELWPGSPESCETLLRLA
jgi:uncharacterized membrane protein YkvA (DUF1232 family)